MGYKRFFSTKSSFALRNLAHQKPRPPSNIARLQEALHHFGLNNSHKQYVLNQTTQAVDIKTAEYFVRTVSKLKDKVTILFITHQRQQKKGLVMIKGALSHMQFFTNRFKHHIGQAQALRALPQCLIHHGLVTAITCISSSLKCVQDCVIHTHGNADFACHLSLQFSQNRHIFSPLGIGKMG